MRGFCGIGVYHPKYDENVGTLLRSAWCFGAAFTFTIGAERGHHRQASNTPCSWRHVPHYRFENLDDLELPVDCPLVGVELDEQAASLAGFVHPPAACYLLGAEDHGLPEAIRERCHRLVQIEGARMCLNVAVAGSIILWDRARKNGGAT